VEGILLAVTEEGPPWALNVLILLTVPALVAMNGLFVAAEFALVAVRRTRVEQLVNEGVKGARAVEKAVASLDRSIAATQLGITLASIGLGFVGEPALARLLIPLFDAIPDSWQFITAHTLSVTLAFILITFMHVVFGELIPKTITLQVPERMAFLLAKPLLLFARLTRPFTMLMYLTANAILGRWGVKAGGETMVHSVEELHLLIEDTEEAGLIEEEQADLVHNVFTMSSKMVRDCMVPREKMASLELNTPPEKVMEIVRSGAHTRLPVYEGDLNNIVGIVNTKDLFYLFSLQGVVVLQDALYQAVFLPADEPVINGLRLFKKTHRHMALVRDDKDNIVGLITLEDVLEEIVGDLEDEHDRPVPRVQRVVRRVLPRPAPKPPEKK
jgi:CBS domain containing-hemolysin-like protein